MLIGREPQTRPAALEAPGCQLSLAERPDMDATAAIDRGRIRPARHYGGLHVDTLVSGWPGLACWVAHANSTVSARKTTRASDLRYGYTLTAHNTADRLWRPERAPAGRPARYPAASWTKCQSFFIKARRPPSSRSWSCAGPDGFDLPLQTCVPTHRGREGVCRLLRGERQRQEEERRNRRLIL